MKHSLIISLLFLSFKGYCQKLPDELRKRPDGITIEYFDFSDTKNLLSKTVFLGANLNFKFPTHNNFERIDISEKKVEIGIIEKKLTADLIKKALQCCTRKKCPDSIKGYFLVVKKGDDLDYITIDYNFISLETCGSEKLNEIIKLFEKL